MRGELETEQRLQHIDPPTLLAITAFLSRSPELLNRGPDFHSSILSPTHLDFLSPGLYNDLTFTYILRASQFALNSTLRQSRLSPDIYSGAFLLLTAWPGSICNRSNSLKICISPCVYISAVFNSLSNSTFLYISVI